MLVRIALVTALAVTLLTPGLAGAGGSSSDTTQWEDASARDPIEPANRGTFRFNDTLDVYGLEPVARGWDWLAPDSIQRAISNFFANLRFPVNVTNNILQGKVAGGLVTIGRFAINSTLGVAGFFDPAAEWGLDARPEDFGQTLGRWGTPPGPYLVIPLLGPTNVRDGGGAIVDVGLSVVPFFVNGWILFGGSVVSTVNDRTASLEEVRDARAASLDYYVFVRNAYFQRRQALIRDLDIERRAAPENDLYDEPGNDNARD